MKLPHGWDVPESVRERLGRRRAGRQRVIAEEGHLLLVLHKPPRKDDDEPEGVLFWRNLEGNWRSSAGGGLNALREHLRTYAELESRLEEKHNKSQTASDLFGVLEELSPLTRAATHQYEALQAARQAIGPDPETLDLRDEAYSIQRAFELLYTEAKHRLEYDIARRAEQQALSSHQAVISAHRLNALMALFLPLTAVASVFGMNLGSGFENVSEFSFWAVLMFALVLGHVVRKWVMRPEGPAASESRGPASSESRGPAA